MNSPSIVFMIAPKRARELAFVADLCYNTANSECRSRRANAHRLTRTGGVQVLTIDDITPAAAARFWSYVDQSGGADSCWPWTGGRTKRGYGCAHINGRTLMAHRVAYKLTNGPIPLGDGHHGTCVCHACDNPPCCNPSHLWLGTIADNSADMVAKGRGAIGNRNGSARLTEDDIPLIRKALARGEPQSSIAARFDVSRENISKIACGKTWDHVEEGRDLPAPGCDQRGSLIANAKLTEQDIPAIRDALARGEYQASIAQRYGIGQSAISSIACGKTWGHVQ